MQIIKQSVHVFVGHWINLHRLFSCRSGGSINFPRIPRVSFAYFLTSYSYMKLMKKSSWPMSCLKPGLGYLPMFWSLFAGVALAICYSIARSRGHIYPYIPAISDTGLKIPENAIFAESFNFIAYSVLVLMVIRYFQVREILATGSVEEIKGNALKKLNKGSLFLGSLSAFGATLVGNFKSERVRYFRIILWMFLVSFTSLFILLKAPLNISKVFYSEDTQQRHINISGTSRAILAN